MSGKKPRRGDIPIDVPFLNLLLEWNGLDGTADPHESMNKVKLLALDGTPSLVSLLKAVLADQHALMGFDSEALAFEGLKEHVRERLEEKLGSLTLPESDGGRLQIVGVLEHLKKSISSVSA